jgi:hypothetical protein
MAYKISKYFLNGYLGDANAEKKKTLRFTGRRIEASESAIHKATEALAVLFAEGLYMLTTGSNEFSSSL